mgnify:CR=1 FL=1
MEARIQERALLTIATSVCLFVADRYARCIFSHPDIWLIHHILISNNDCISSERTSLSPDRVVHLSRVPRAEARDIYGPQLLIASFGFSSEYLD